MIPIVAIFTIFVLAPIAMSISRLLWKRGSLKHVVQAPDNTQRLEHMEQALDSIAIEMERVFEGQRFAQPLPLPVGEKAGAPRF